MLEAQVAKSHLYSSWSGHKHVAWWYGQGGSKCAVGLVGTGQLPNGQLPRWIGQQRAQEAWLVRSCHSA